MAKKKQSGRKTITLKRINSPKFRLLSDADFTAAFSYAYVDAGGYHGDTQFNAYVEEHGSKFETIQVKYRKTTLVTIAKEDNGNFYALLYSPEPVFYGSSTTSVTLPKGFPIAHYRKVLHGIFKLMVQASDTAEVISNFNRAVTKLAQIPRITLKRMSK